MTISINKRDILGIVQTTILVAVLILILWQKPWSSTKASTPRTVTVSGQGSVMAEADEFTFNPSYDFKAATKDEVLELLATKASEVTSGLKAIGLEDKDIRIDANSYNYWYLDEQEDIARTSLYISVVTGNDKSQEVQDYLLSTSPTGSITPQPSFSNDKQKELADEARIKAIADAKRSSEKSANELGLKVKSVISVEEVSSSPYSGPYPYAVDSVAFSSEASPSIPVQTGEQDFTVNVKVVFEVK